VTLVVMIADAVVGRTLAEKGLVEWWVWVA
jgi:hypothetical protein